MAPQSPFHQMLVDALPRLRAYAMILTRSRAHADDLLQQTAYRALRSETQFTMGTNFLGWMYRILRNEYISTLRRAKRSPSCLDDVPEDLFARHGDQEDKLLTNEVIAAMDNLPTSQREVLVLVCAGGLSYDEAAASIGCSVGTVKSRLWRARQHMQELVLGTTVPGASEGLKDAPARPAVEHASAP
jgi:RNA polymerase sigma-70 factor (ECF subfamily)